MASSNHSHRLSALALSSCPSRVLGEKDSEALIMSLVVLYFVKLLPFASFRHLSDCHLTWLPKPKAFPLKGQTQARKNIDMGSN